MLNNRARRELKINQRQILIDSIETGIPSPEQILSWGEHRLPNGKQIGLVKNSKTVNYKRFTPFKDGLFCERIFGPVNSFVCACGKKQVHSKVLFCEKCQVQYIDQRSRRYRLGYISLISPVTHIWYLKGRPSYLSLFLGKRKKTIVALAYCNAYLMEHGISRKDGEAQRSKLDKFEINNFDTTLQQKKGTFLSQKIYPITRAGSSCKVGGPQSVIDGEGNQIQGTSHIFKRDRIQQFKTNYLESLYPTLKEKEDTVSPDAEANYLLTQKRSRKVLKKEANFIKSFTRIRELVRTNFTSKKTPKWVNARNLYTGPFIRTYSTLELARMGLTFSHGATRPLIRVGSGVGRAWGCASRTAWALPSPTPCFPHTCASNPSHGFPLGSKRTCVGSRVKGSKRVGFALPTRFGPFTSKNSVLRVERSSNSCGKHGQKPNPVREAQPNPSFTFSMCKKLRFQHTCKNCVVPRVPKAKLPFGEGRRRTLFIKKAEQSRTTYLGYENTQRKLGKQGIVNGEANDIKQNSVESAFKRALSLVSCKADNSALNGASTRNTELELRSTAPKVLVKGSASEMCVRGLHTRIPSLARSSFNDTHRRWYSPCLYPHSEAVTRLRESQTLPYMRFVQSPLHLLSFCKAQSNKELKERVTKHRFSSSKFFPNSYRFDLNSSSTKATPFVLDQKFRKRKIKSYLDQLPNCNSFTGKLLLVTSPQTQGNMVKPLTRFANGSRKPKPIRFKFSQALSTTNLYNFISESPRYKIDFYTRQHTLPFLPSLVSHFYVRNALLDYMDSPIKEGDLPLVVYCQNKRYSPLRDVHKFMAHQTVSKFNLHTHTCTDTSKNFVLSRTKPSVKGKKLTVSEGNRVRAKTSFYHSRMAPSHFQCVRSLSSLRLREAHGVPKARRASSATLSSPTRARVWEASPQTQRQESTPELLSGLEVTAIREILSYTGGGALQRLLERFETHSFCKFLLAETEILRIRYLKLISGSPSFTGTREYGYEDAVLPTVLSQRQNKGFLTSSSSHTRYAWSDPSFMQNGHKGEKENAIFTDTGSNGKTNFLALPEDSENAHFFKKQLPDLQKKQLLRLSRRIYKTARRLKVVQLLTRNNRRPEWMTLSHLPVLPPDLRPILQMSEKVIVASDLNIMYQRVIYRNNRHLRVRFIDFHLVTSIQRLVQDAVDRLIENGKGGSKPYYTQGGRPLKSLSDTLKGKKGRFRLNLLGKRVDFSGRSVIVVSPSCKIHECGLPKTIALELYHYFLLRELILKKHCLSIVTAKKMIKERAAFVYPILRQLMYNHPVLLNRAPTLHRLGIQAFQPKLVLGNAILLHPLVCSGFNADFDGDQMGVHLPLSFAARAESWDLLWSRNNLLSPATGQPILVPSQDMVLGFYYMTAKSKPYALTESVRRARGKTKFSSERTGNHNRTTTEGCGRLWARNIHVATQKNSNTREPQPNHNRRLWKVVAILDTSNQVLQSFQKGKIGLHTPIWLQWNGLIENEDASQSPLELRINSFGLYQYVYSNSMYYKFITRQETTKNQFNSKIVPSRGIQLDLKLNPPATKGRDVLRSKSVLSTQVHRFEVERRSYTGQAKLPTHLKYGGTTEHPHTCASNPSRAPLVHGVGSRVKGDECAGVTFTVREAQTSLKLSSKQKCYLRTTAGRVLMNTILEKR